jgi:hypothetical protein
MHLFLSRAHSYTMSDDATRIHLQKLQADLDNIKEQINNLHYDAAYIERLIRETKHTIDFKEYMLQQDVSNNIISNNDDDEYISTRF